MTTARSVTYRINYILPYIFIVIYIVLYNILLDSACAKFNMEFGVVGKIQNDDGGLRAGRSTPLKCQPQLGPHNPVNRKKQKKKGKGKNKGKFQTDDATHTDNGIDAEIMLESLEGMYEMDILKAALKQLQDNKNDLTIESLTSLAFGIQSDQDSGVFSMPEQTPVSKLKEDTASDPAARGSEESAEETEESEFEDEYTEQLHEALDEVKAEYKYKIQQILRYCLRCEERPANILLLPCGHLACCENCLMDVKRCPSRKCNKIIRGTKEVFFA